MCLDLLNTPAKVEADNKENTSKTYRKEKPMVEMKKNSRKYEEVQEIKESAVSEAQGTRIRLGVEIREEGLARIWEWS